jgi:hypothetical protein
MKKPIIKGKYCLATPIIPFPQINYSIDYDAFDKLLFDKASDFLEGEEKEKFEKEKKPSGIVRRMIETVNLAEGRTFRIGICIPTTCKTEDVENAINKCEFA